MDKSVESSFFDGMVFGKGGRFHRFSPPIPKRSRPLRVIIKIIIKSYNKLTKFSSKFSKFYKVI